MSGGSPTPEADRRGLEARLGHRFRDPRLLEIAMTHRSWAYERGGEEENYERLEFLGDAVLGAVVAAWLYRRVDEPEGELSKLKGLLVSAPVLAEHARSLGLGERLRLGVGEERSGGREKESLLADAFEAVLGALYLDGGIEPVRGLLEPWLARDLEALHRSAAVADPKTTLQEVLQAEGRPLPDYRVAAETGPDHDKTFTVECVIDGEVRGVGSGSSKKRAEQEAAGMALSALGGDS